jgi:hypothetical protein
MINSQIRWGAAPKNFQRKYALDIPDSVGVRTFLPLMMVCTVLASGATFVQSGKAELYQKGYTASVNNQELPRRQRSVIKIRDFAKLSIGWDGYKALPIPNTVINRTLNIIERLKIQPQYIFPSGRETIQLEYDIADKSLEIEIGADNIEFLSFDGNIAKEWESNELSDVLLSVTEFHTKKIAS